MSDLMIKAYKKIMVIHDTKCPGLRPSVIPQDITQTEIALQLCMQNPTYTA